LLRVDLLEDFAGGSQRFHEDGLFVGNEIRDFVKIFYGERKVFANAPS